MKLSGTAKVKLTALLPKGAAGFSVTGFVGTCRGSTPVFHPAQEAKGDQVRFVCENITFFVNPEIAAEFRDCEIDYDRSFFGKGLIVTWPHRTGCACHS